jgi:hypothetical protein
MPHKANLEAPLYELPSRSVVAMLSGVRHRMVVETMRRRIGALTCTPMWKIQVEKDTSTGAKVEVQNQKPVT